MSQSEKNIWIMNYYLYFRRHKLRFVADDPTLSTVGLSCYGSRSFTVCGPAAWNSLPAAVQDLCYLHHHPVSASISKLNYLAERMAIIHLVIHVVA